MPRLRFGQHHLPTLVAAVLLLHACVLWALQGSLLQRAAATEPAVVQLTFVAAPQARPPALAHTPAAPKPAIAAQAAMPAPARPAAPAPSVVAPAAQALATALPVAAQGLAVPAAPAAASTGLAQTTAAVAAAATPAAAVASKAVLPTVDADYLYAPKLEYPRMSVKLNEHGRVLVNVYIGTDGQAQKAEVKSSSGYARLDQAALSFVLGQRFVPGKVGGVAEAMWYAVPVKFGFND